MTSGRVCVLGSFMADLIVHAHTADSGRLAPGAGDYPQAEFFARLRAHTRCDRCSIECAWRDFEHELAPALTALESWRSRKRRSTRTP